MCVNFYINWVTVDIILNKNIGDYRLKCDQTCPKKIYKFFLGTPEVVKCKILIKSNGV